MFESVIRKIESAGLIPVVTADNPENAVKLAGALQSGGIRAIEITFRTKQGERGLNAVSDSIRAVRSAYPDMLIGAGTAINSSLAQKAVAAGAQFIVSPGFNPDTVDYCITQNIPIIPGISSASQIEAALERGLSVLKFFPAEASGGVKTLKAFSGPFPGVKFMATGGINEQNITDYIKCPNIIAVGGSWMVQDSLLREKNWDKIAILSRRAVAALLGFKFAHVGLNFDTESAAAEGASVLSLFGYTGTENPASWFCGDSFELMKKKGRGAHGHIGFYTWNIERALTYLERYGFKPVPQTAQWCGEPEKSSLSFIYLDKSVGGFDIHLKRAE